MKIALFEVSSITHSVMIYNWFHICRINNWQFSLFTTEEIYKVIRHDIDIKDEELYVMKEISITEFFKVSKYLDNYDICILTSVQSYFFHYLVLLLSKVNFVVTIHNLNAWFLTGNKQTLKGKLKFIVRSLWKVKAKAFVVNSNNMLDYVKSKELTNKPLTVLPFSLRHKSIASLDIKDSEVFKIVYPGMVSTKRKSYDLFLLLATEFPNIEFVLLGKLMMEEGGEEILKKIDDMKLLNVKYYNSYVDQVEFDRVMSSAGLIYSFVNTDYCNDGVTEKYGKTKDSGISYLMLEYGLPLVVNCDFSNFSDLDVSTIYYEDYSGLYLNVNKIIDSDDMYKSLRYSVLNVRKSYSITAYSYKIKNFFLEELG